MTNALALLQNREIEIAALFTLRLVNTTQIFRFQNFLDRPYTWRGLDFANLAFDVQSNFSGRGLGGNNISYLVNIPEQKRFSVKHQALQHDGFRNSLVQLAFVFPGQLDDTGSDVEPVRHQRFKVRSSLLKNSILSMEIDSLTDANFSAIGDLLTFPTFRRQHHPQRNSHYNYPR